MSVKIQTRSDLPFWDMQVTLEDVTYTLEFRWNVRAEAWFMSVLDSEGVNLLQGDLKLVADVPLAAYTTDRNPPGAFFLRDTTGATEEPGREDLGDRHQLYYFTAEDLGLE